MVEVGGGIIPLVGGSGGGVIPVVGGGSGGGGGDIPVVGVVEVVLGGCLARRSQWP